MGKENKIMSIDIPAMKKLARWYQMKQKTKSTLPMAKERSFMS